ncbi:glutathione S-transferase family protein [Elioraea tepida]|nr:glutathione S-transferase [Elioraea tepida]
MKGERRMRRILGRANSLNVMKVLWACAELGLNFVREDLGGPFGGLDTPAYRALNPNRLVPVLVEPDGWSMWESNAILRYLAATYGKGTALWPDDPRARARADQWMDWQQTAANAALGPAFVQMYRTPPEKRDETVIAKSLARAAEVFRLLEEHLAAQPFVAGEAFSLGDIPIGCHVYRYLHMPIERPDFPALAAYHARLSARPGYAAHVAVGVT